MEPNRAEPQASERSFACLIFREKTHSMIANFSLTTTKTQHTTWNLADSNFGGPNVLTVFYMALAAGVSTGFICSPKPKKGF